MLVYPPFPEAMVSAIKSSEDFIVIGHVSPDGDCLMSELAMGDLLKALGKNVLLANAGPFERDEIACWRPSFVQSIDADYLAKKPTVIIVDCSTEDRIGSLAEEIKGLQVLVIDHHASGVHWGDICCIVPESPSTTLLVQHLFHTFGVEIGKETATRLFFGFATDTGYFKFLNQGQGEALRMSAELVDKGVSPNMAYAQMTGGKRYSFVKYLGLLLDRTQSFLDGRVYCSYAYLSDADTFGADKPSDLFYGQMLTVKDCQAVLLLKEKADGKTEIGFRSSHASKVDVGKIAASFGGGGHQHASGLTVQDTIPSIQAKLLQAIEQMLG